MDSPTGRVYFACDGVCGFGADIGDRNCCAFGCEAEGDGTADAASPAGDDRYLIFELHR